MTLPNAFDGGAGESSQPDYLSSDAPADRGGGGKKKTAAILAGSLAAVSILGGGAVAYNLLNSSDDYPYGHFADGAVAYSQINIDPSAQQKLELNSLVKKFPELEEESEVDFAVDELVGELVKEALEDDGDYSYVGDRAAFAIYPDNDGDESPEYAILISTDDEKKAGELAKKIADKINDEEVQEEDFAPAYPDQDEAWMESSGDGADSPEDLAVGEASGTWAAVSNGDMDKIFSSDKTLADNKDFTDQFGEVEGNIFGAWGDFGDLHGLMEEDEYSESLPVTEGSGTFTVEARDDGIDLKAKTYGLKVDNVVPISKGDSGDLTKALEENSYEEATFSFGVSGLGETLENYLKESDNDFAEEFGIEGDQTSEFIGDIFTVSLHGNTLEDLSGKVMVGGIDKEVWDQALDANDVTIEDFEEELNREEIFEGEMPFDVSLEEDSASLTLNDAPEGGQEFDEGNVTGRVDLDQLARLIHNMPFFGTNAGPKPYDGPEDIGVVEFHHSIDEDGDGEAELSWTTRRD